LFVIFLGAFKTYFPKVWFYHSQQLEKITSQHPELCRPFPASIYPSATYNLGPQTACLDHVDSENSAGGVCAITALGSFDPTLEGHLVLPELCIALEFPPGATVLIPSSVIAHGNTRVQGGSTRYSFTCYCAGQLISYAELGKNFNKLTEKEKAIVVDMGEAVISRFSTLKGWPDDVNWVQSEQNAQSTSSSSK
jgi:hypothetical protein